MLYLTEEEFEEIIEKTIKSIKRWENEAMYIKKSLHIITSSNYYASLGYESNEPIFKKLFKESTKHRSTLNDYKNAAFVEVELGIEQGAVPTDVLLEIYSLKTFEERWCVWSNSLKSSKEKKREYPTAPMVKKAKEEYKKTKASDTKKPAIPKNINTPKTTISDDSQEPTDPETDNDSDSDSDNKVETDDDETSEDNDDTLEADNDSTDDTDIGFSEDPDLYKKLDTADKAMSYVRLNYEFNNDFIEFLNNFMFRLVLFKPQVQVDVKRILTDMDEAELFEFALIFDDYYETKITNTPTCHT